MSVFYLLDIEILAIIEGIERRLGQSSNKTIKPLINTPYLKTLYFVPILTIQFLLNIVNYSAFTLN